jgi:hypothetical protein
MADRKLIDSYRDAVSLLIVIMAFLLPLKFGTLTGLPEVASYYPDSAFAWLIISWPAVAFPMFTGIIMLLTMTAFPLKGVNLCNQSFVSAMLWSVLLLVGLLGIVNASVWDFVIMELVHLAGIAAFAFAVYLMLSNYPERKNWLYGAIFAGTVLTIYLGLEQMFSGFEETRKFVEQREAMYNIKIKGDLKARIWTDRVFASFASSNSLAGYLLLAGPLCFMFLWKLCGRIEPPKVARFIFIPIFLISFFIVFGGTVARAGFLTLILALAAFIAIFKVDWRLRWAVWLVSPVVIVGGAIYIYVAGRGFESMTVRLDYFWASLKMLAAHPLFGTGWGDFFHDYMRLKLVISKEAPHTPHNLFMALGGQTGVFGLVACIGAVVYPLFCGFRKICGHRGKELYLSLDSALFLGLLAFVFHAMMDVDLQIPALMATAVALMVALLIPDAEEKEKVKGGYSGKLASYVIILSVGLTAAFGGMHLLRSEYVFSQLTDLCDFRNKKPEDFMKITPDEVKSYLQNAVKVRPYSPFPWATAGDFMFGRQLFDAAEDFYSRASALAPERSFLYHRLYILQSLQGRTDEAQKNLKKAQELFPNNPAYKTTPPELQMRPGPFKQ